MTTSDAALRESVRTLPELVALLRGGPSRFASLVTGLPDALLHRDEGPDTWSPAQVIGHVLDAERSTWISRLEIILRGPAETVLPTFDRHAHLRYFADADLADLLRQFADLRSQNLQRLEALALDEAALERRAVHETFGPVTARQLLHTWAAHDWSHHAQIVRIVAHGMRTGVGPWVKFLSVMQPRERPS